MAIPYLLGLATGSIAVVSWKYFKANQKMLPENDPPLDLTQKSADDEAIPTDSPSKKTTSTRKKA